VASGAVDQLLVTNDTGGSPVTSIVKGLDARYGAVVILEGDPVSRYLVTHNVDMHSLYPTFGSFIPDNVEYNDELGVYQWNLHANEPGVTPLTASWGAEISDPVDVTITDKEPADFVCRPSLHEMTVDDTAQFLGVIIWTDGTEDAVTDELAMGTVGFDSSVPDVASFEPVDPNGVLTGNSVGTTVVTATWDYNGWYDTCDVIVVEQMSSRDCENAMIIPPETQMLFGSNINGYNNVWDDPLDTGWGRDVWYVFTTQTPVSVSAEAIPPADPDPLWAPTMWLIPESVEYSCDDFVGNGYIAYDGYAIGMGSPLRALYPYALDLEPNTTYYLVVDGDEMGDIGSYWLDLVFSPYTRIETL
jgi:hypothetical protein